MRMFVEFYNQLPDLNFQPAAPTLPNVATPPKEV